MERRPSTDRHAWNCPSYLFVEGNEKAAEEFVKYGTTEAITARHDHDRLSGGLSTQTRFDRFSVIRILLLLGFSFYYK